MARIFARFQKENITVFYINMNPPLVLSHPLSIAAAADGRLSRVLELARQYSNVQVVTNAMEGLWQNPKMMTDEIHPNDTGYAEMCGRIFNQVKLRSRR